MQNRLKAEEVTVKTEGRNEKSNTKKEINVQKENNRQCDIDIDITCISFKSSKKTVKL